MTDREGMFLFGSSNRSLAVFDSSHGSLSRVRVTRCCESPSERPVIGCAICAAKDERRVGEKGTKERGRKGWMNDGPVESRGVVVVLVPYYGSECSLRAMDVIRSFSSSVLPCSYP